MHVMAYFEEDTLVFKVPGAHPAMGVEHLQEFVFRAIALSSCHLSRAEIKEAILRGMTEAFHVFSVGFDAPVFEEEA